ncbi:GPM6B protein, partial [Polypterus senegalus]
MKAEYQLVQIGKVEEVLPIPGKTLGFIVLTYIIAVIWLFVFACSALPVYILHNMSTTCQTITLLSETSSGLNQLCMDARQYGVLPWNATPGKVCGMTLVAICKTKEVGIRPFKIPTMSFSTVHCALHNCESLHMLQFDLTFDLYIAAFTGAAATLIALVHFLMRLSANWAYTKDSQKVKAYNCIRAKEIHELEEIQKQQSCKEDVPICPKRYNET